MYEYHGWLSTFEILDAGHLLTELKNINSSHPVSAQYVNGKLHISFSGFSNRNSGQVAKMVDYLCRLNGKLSGCIYTNDADADSDRYNKFDVIKIVDDKVIEMHDKNFTDEETKQLFE